MKKSIKIALIAIVAIGIVAAIAYFAQSIGSGVTKVIATTDFEKQVQDSANKNIKGKDFPSARIAFNSILAEINTEASITLGDGKKSLSSSEVAKSKQIVFYEYAPIFTDYGTKYFTRSSWDDNTLKDLKGEATTLLQLKIAETGTDVDRDLKSIIKNVDEYYAAWKVANAASRCTSVSAIASYKTQANNYLHSPLTNNASLSSALRNAEAAAKNSVVRNIAGYCNHIASSYTHYGSYAAFYSAYNSGLNRINEYKNKYGMPSQLNSAKSSLNAADSRALSYYSTEDTDSGI